MIGAVLGVVIGAILGMALTCIVVAGDESRNIACVKPEQAIAATLGRGTCHIEQVCHERIAGCDNYHDEFACSECGSDMFEHFNFCPNCGAKVVEE